VVEVEVVVKRSSWRYGVALALGIAVVSAACSQRTCTLVGCSGSVAVEVTGVPGISTGSKVRMCVEGRSCLDGFISADETRMYAFTPTSGTHPDQVTVSDLVVTDGGGNVLYRGRSDAPAEPKTHYPNGPECGSGCWSASFIVRDGKVEPVPT
jgi:hypothetical protein